MARIWNLISNEALAGLVRLQYKHYSGVKLEPPVEDKQSVTVVGKIEDMEEIDKLMREKPRYGRDTE